MKAHKLSLHDVIVYLILIPFLNPRGFYEVLPMYKTLVTGWMYLALLMILFEICMQYKGTIVYMKKKAEITVFVYFATMILITLTAQGGLHEGLQNMIATPILCLYGIFCLRKDAEKFLITISNILLVLFILNLTIFNPYVMQYKIAGYHMIFLGHVQVAGQFGMLGILCGCLLYSVSDSKKKKSILLIIVSVLTMLTSGTASAMLVVTLVVLFAVLYRLKLYEIFCKGIQIYVILFAVLGAGLVIINSELPNMIVSFLNSRHQIWNVAMQTFMEAPIIGYGIQGVSLEMYWGSEINYAHSQFAQNLLDGGMILCILFYTMVFFAAVAVRSARGRGLRVLGTLTLTAYLCISLFESLSFYPYFYLTLILLIYIPEFSEVLEVRKDINVGIKYKQGEKT